MGWRIEIWRRWWERDAYKTGCNLRVNIVRNHGIAYNCREDNKRHTITTQWLLDLVRVQDNLMDPSNHKRDRYLSNENYQGHRSKV